MTAPQKKYRAPNLDDVRAALSFIPSHDRELWYRVGMAIKSAFDDDAGFSVWDAWSQTDDSYNEKNARAVWRSFNKNGVGLGTLYHEAKSRGFHFDKKGKTLTPEEEKELKAKAEKKRQEDDRKAKQRTERAKATADTLWNQAKIATDHPYLTRKGIEPHAVRAGRYVYYCEGKNLPKCVSAGLDTQGKWERRVKENCLLIPLRDTEGTLWNLQAIFPETDTELDRDKDFISGGRVSGLSFAIGRPGEVICVCEGFATGASIREATGHAVRVAFNAGNLEHVAKRVREKHPEAKLVVCADNDQWTKGNPGLTKATVAAKAVGGFIAVPVFRDTTDKKLRQRIGSISAEQPKDFNDMARLEGKERVREVIDGATEPDGGGNGTENGHDIPENNVSVTDNAPADSGNNIGTDNASANATSNAATFDQRVKELALMHVAEYEAIRTEEADKLNVRANVLDKAVKRLRPSDDNGAGTALDFEELDPWEESVNGAELLDDIAETFRRFIVLPEHAAEAMSLWTLFTYVFDSMRICPMLALTSPQKRCGKTSTLTLLLYLCNRPQQTNSIPAPALFRTVEKFKPTLLIDEADTFISEDEGLRGILNSGHTREYAYSIRCVGDDHEPRKFSTWGPKAVACIGDLWDTLQDRSITIRLKRKAPTERVEKLRRFDGTEIKRKCLKWSNSNAGRLANAIPEVPEDLNDRAADNWEPLLAIADLSGGEWPEKARKAALTLSGEDAADTTQVLLLSDIRDILETEEHRTRDYILSQELLQALIAIEGRPWGDWSHGKAITARGLAKQLKPFGIEPDDIRIAPGPKDVKKGYRREALAGEFDRYLPERDARTPENGILSATCATTLKTRHFEQNLSATGKDVVADKNDVKPLKNRHVADVADKTPENGETHARTEPPEPYEPPPEPRKWERSV